MKCRLLFLLLLCSVAACKKDDPKPDPNPDPIIHDSTIAGVRFTNQLEMRVIIDIYDTATVPHDSFYSYSSRFRYHKTKMRLIANPNATVVLPKDSFNQGWKYYYDWYTDSLDISSWANVTDAERDSMAAEYRAQKPFQSDSMLYRLNFRYDSTTKGINIKMNGKPEKWRKMFDRWTIWALAAVYDSSGAIVSQPILPQFPKNREIYIGTNYGVSGIGMGTGVFYFDNSGPDPMLRAVWDKTLYGVISQKFAFAGLSTTARDTLFYISTHPDWDGYIYKMYRSKHYK